MTDWIDDLESTLRNLEGYDDVMSIMQALDDATLDRPHLRYISDRLKDCIQAVERGENRRLIVSLPPRHGKTTECAVFCPLWVLSRHKDWQIGIASYGATLAERSGREIRRLIESNPQLGLTISKDVKSSSQWEVMSDTRKRGGVIARGVGSGLTGFGARVLIVDDPFKDFVEAHSPVTRAAVWNWWLSVALTRMESPSLIIVIQTRWHEDDLVGRLLSSEYEGNPDDWEVIRIPAIADTDEDPLGREIGEPLLAPYTNETRDEALARWADLKVSVGGYVWAALYQQSPAPSKGTIVDTSWFHFWTTDPNRVSLNAEGEPDGHVVLIDPEQLRQDQATVWLSSWDMGFKKTDDSDYVVGQIWARDRSARRFLMDQVRARMSFSQTIAAMRMMTLRWACVARHLVEEAANGAAVIDTLKKEITGIKPTHPDKSKEVRLRAVTPEMESGHVYLPHPLEDGYGWVIDLLDELRKFPFDSHDDQVDATSQGLFGIRSGGSSTVASPVGHRKGQQQKRTTNLVAARIRR